MEIRLKTKTKQLLFTILAILAILGSVDTALAQTNTISVSSPPLQFSGGVGQIAPQPINVTVASTSTTPVPFTVAAASDMGNWLGVSSTSGTALQAGLPIQVFVNTSAISVLTTGTHTGTVTITPASGTPVILNATFVVGTSGSGPGTVTATPNPVNFSVAPLTAATSQIVTVTSTGSSTAFNLVPINQPSWLSLSTTAINAGSSNPGTFTITATPGTLGVGTYTAQIQIIPQGQSTALQTVTVNLTVGTGTGTGGLSANPNTLSFSFAASSSASSTQNVTINNPTNNFEVLNVTATTTSGGNWLSVPGSQTSLFPMGTSMIPVTVNPSALSSGQSYQGTVTVSSTDLGTVSIPVNVTVGTTGASTITASPNPLNITIPAGSSTTTNGTITVSSASSSLVLVNAAITNGPSWLGVTPTSQSIITGTPVTFSVTANPSGVSSGTYQGTVTFTPVGGNPISVPVNVTVGSAPAITLSPGALNFAYQIGTSFPPAQSFSISSTAASTAFSVAATTQSGGNWLVITPQNGATSATPGALTPISVQINPSGLQPGNYQGTVTVSGSGISNSPQTVTVNLLVSNQPIITLNPGSVTFNYQFNTTTPPQPQQVQVTSSGNPLMYNVSTAPGSGGNWLQVSPNSGTTPGSLSLSVNSSVLAGLAPGTYLASVTLTAFGAGNATTTIPVALVIGNNPLLTVSQSSMNFNYEITQTLPASQTLSIGSTAGPLNYTVASNSANCSLNFLNVTPTSGTTPGTLAVSVNVQGLIAGTCNGTITITAPGAGNSPLTIPVTVQVSNSALLNVSPSAINLTTQVNSSPPNQTIALTSTDPTMALPFTVSVTTNSGGNGWLLVGPTSGSTPNNLTVGFQTSGLPAGTYTGTITVTPTTGGLTPSVIPVSLVVTSSVTASTSASNLTFTQALNSPNPAVQQVQITSTTPGLTYSATATTLSGGNWLSVSNPNGTTPGTINVSANGAGLAQGSYSGVVTVQIPGAANATLSIPVTFNVTAAQTLTLSATSASFNYQQGATTSPASQTIQISSTGAAAVPFTATVNSATNGLFTITPSSGTTPATLTIGLNQSVLSSLAPNTYTGSVTVATSGGGSMTINLSVTVAAAPPPAFTAVVNAASSAPGAVAPGEIVSIYGMNLGPTSPIGVTLTSSGMVATTAGNTQVLFDGTPAPLLYVSSGQVNAIVPYEIAGRVTTNMVISRNGVASSPLQLLVANTSPGIFSLSQGGNGQGAILNSNNTVNGSGNPATKGSVIQIFTTGEGALVPAVPTGSVTPNTANPPKPSNVPTVTVGGAPATVTFYGEAPGLVSGVMQINVIVPQGIGSGPQAVVLNSGGNGNQQQQISVAVQ